MASTAVAPYPNHHAVNLFGHNFDEQLDFFDQFVKFDPDEGSLYISTGDEQSESWNSNHESEYHEHVFCIPSPVISSEASSSSLPLPLSTGRNLDSKVKTTRPTVERSDKLLRSSIRKSTEPIGRRSRSTCKSLDTYEKEIDRILNPFNDEPHCTTQSNNLSAPPSAQVSDAAGSGNDHGAVILMSTKYSMSAIDSQLRGDTPIGTPALGEACTPYQPSFGSLTTPVTPQNRQFSSLWSQLPDADQYYRSPIYNSSNFHDLQETPPIWWSHSASTTLAQPSPNSFHRNSQLATKSLASQLQTESSLHTTGFVEAPANTPSGLMILMDGSISQEHDGLPGDSLDFAQIPPYNLTHHPEPNVSPTLFVSPDLDHSLSSPFTTRRTRHSSHPCAPPSIPSPSTSPPLPRRKTRPSKSTATTTTKLNTLKGTVTSPSVIGGLNFVNYTPNDKRKLLNGVAPSGSSRTKARREREAAERRRRISEAAMRAVIEAGGDLGGLVEQGIFL